MLVTQVSSVDRQLSLPDRISPQTEAQNIIMFNYYSFILLLAFSSFHVQQLLIDVFVTFFRVIMEIL